MRVNATGRSDPDRLRKKGVIAHNRLFWEASSANDFLATIYVMEESIDHPHPLFDPARQFLPFGIRNDARYKVERDRPFFGYPGGRGH